VPAGGMTRRITLRAVPPVVTSTTAIVAATAKAPHADRFMFVDVSFCECWRAAESEPF
jgi:hypothetical protein